MEIDTIEIEPFLQRPVLEMTLDFPKFMLELQNLS